MSYISVLPHPGIEEFNNNLYQEEAEKSGLERIQKALLEGKPARSVEISDLERESIRQLCLLTMKPVIYVANVAESDLADTSSNPHVDKVAKVSAELDSGMVVISAQVMRGFPVKHYFF